MSSLFQTIKINEKISFKNKIVMSPMCQYSAKDGMPTNWHFVHYVSRAVGGVGAIIQEATAINPEGRITFADLGIWNDKQVAVYKKINTEIKKYDCVPGIQLAHAGRKASTKLPWEGSKQLAPNDINGWQTVSSSNIPFNEEDVLPHALTIEEIKKIINDFKLATRRSIEAGFEIIELHAAHGYLISQFLSPLVNNRKDEYGGSFENRIKFLLEIIKAVKEEITTQSLWVRISATDWCEGGWNLEDTKKLALIIEKLGVDVLDVSTGGTVKEQVIKVEKEYQVPYAKGVKDVSTMLVGAVGLIETGLEAEKILNNNAADLIFVGRELLRNPYFAITAEKELGDNPDWVNQYKRALRK